MLTGTAVYGTVRTVVWEDGGSNPASYPIVHELLAVSQPLVPATFTDMMIKTITLMYQMG